LTAPQITDLWLEYETCSSPEARVAKNLDKFEMILQADEVREREREILYWPFDDQHSTNYQH
jgi:5'-deoxynucleotidase YfbR-like HD superfamily hydrolase